MECLIELIKEIENSIIEDLAETEDGLSYIDHIDKEEISAHYSMSHAAAGMIIKGINTKDFELLSKGKAILRRLLNNFSSDRNLFAYHYDFNNFALCLLYDTLKTTDPELSNKVKECVLLSSDSNHATINWLPMRMYVAYHKFEWTGDKAYEKQFYSLKQMIDKATYTDGFIDDRLPLGTSFNLQYNVSTVAMLMLVERYSKIDMGISHKAGALIRAICPDGDINYMGRGTNQIFAWGPWLYILSSIGNESGLRLAEDFFVPKARVALANKNIMLNDISGKKKHLWWDYHYSSVYTAHLYLWLVLKEYCGFSCTVENVYEPSDSGLKIIKNAETFIVLFSGRSEYLAESGPAIEAVWTKKYGALIKGAFGPYNGAFGIRYTNPDTVIRNFAGVLSLGKKKKTSMLDKFIKKKNNSINLKPVFGKITVEDSDTLSFVWDFEKSVYGMANIPLMAKPDSISLTCDGKEVAIDNVGTIINQYGECILYQSKAVSGKLWRLNIE